MMSLPKDKKKASKELKKWPGLVINLNIKSFHMSIVVSGYEILSLLPNNDVIGG